MSNAERATRLSLQDQLVDAVNEAIESNCIVEFGPVHLVPDLLLVEFAAQGLDIDASELSRFQRPDGRNVTLWVREDVDADGPA